MRQLANSHTDYGRGIDESQPIYNNFGSFTQISFETLNTAPGAYSGSDPQSFFDYNLRNSLGLDPNGTDFINIDAMDPSEFSLDMFSADELLNSGNNYVTYYGYDHKVIKFLEGLVLMISLTKKINMVITLDQLVHLNQFTLRVILWTSSLLMI